MLFLLQLYRRLALRLRLRLLPVQRQFQFFLLRLQFLVHVQFHPQRLHLRLRQFLRLFLFLPPVQRLRLLKLFAALLPRRAAI